MLSSRFLDDLKEKNEKVGSFSVASGVQKHAAGFNAAPPPRGLESLTSPSLVSTVRTRMLLFPCASVVLVSRFVSVRIKGRDLKDFEGHHNRTFSRGCELNTLNVKL